VRRSRFVVGSGRDVSDTPVGYDTAIDD
jgi:hypothetical protein